MQAAAGPASPLAALPAVSTRCAYNKNLKNINMQISLGQKVRHKEIYNGKEIMEVVGIKKDKVLLKGDFSGGTHKVEQESWLPIKGLITQA